MNATLTKNGDGSFDLVAGQSETMHFDPSGRLVSITDIDGYSTTLAYDGGGHLHTATDSANRALTFSWTGSHISEVDDPLVDPVTHQPTPRSVVYGYDANTGDLVDVKDVNGGHTRFGYDTGHRVVTVQDPRQAVAYPSDKTAAATTNHYDSVGRVDWQRDRWGRPRRSGTRRTRMVRRPRRSRTRPVRVRRRR